MRRSKRVLSLFALRDFRIKALNARNPTHQAHGNHDEPTEEAHELLQEGLDLCVADYNEKVEALEVVADVHEAPEKQKRKTTDNELPTVSGLVKLVPPHVPQKNHYAQQDSGADGLKRDIYHCLIEFGLSRESWEQPAATF